MSEDAPVSAIETKIDESAAETRRQIGIAIEELRSQLRLLAESVLQLHEELRDMGAALEEKLEQTASETRSVIKFSIRSSTGA